MIVLDGKISDKNTHSLPTEWLGARLVAWMFDEAGGSKWWLCALTCEGDYRYASHDNQHKPPLDHVEYARNVNRFVNRVANHGGAWVTGWFDDVRFYMLWKDKDGDLQIPIECDLDGSALKNGSRKTGQSRQNKLTLYGKRTGMIWKYRAVSKYVWRKDKN